MRRADLKPNVTAHERGSKLETKLNQVKTQNSQACGIIDQYLHLIFIAEHSNRTVGLFIF